MGTIKTSVNMMPPAGKILEEVIMVFLLKLHLGLHHISHHLCDGAIDHTQAEVAKTFYLREFGNGSANGSVTGQEGVMQTLVCLVVQPMICAYVMDDGLKFIC